MTAALTLALVGMLAGAGAAQVGTWEAEQEDGRLTLYLGADGSMSASGAIWMGGDTLIVEYSGTWEADGDSLRAVVDPASVTFNGQTPQEQVDQLVALMVAAIEELTGERPTAEQIAEARAEILADLQDSVVIEATHFEVAGDTLTLTDKDGTGTVLTRREPVTAVQATPWGAVKAAAKPARGSNPTPAARNRPRDRPPALRPAPGQTIFRQPSETPWTPTTEAMTPCTETMT